MVNDDTEKELRLTLMNIDGWAFKVDEIELRDKAVTRYDEIKHLRKEMIVEKTVSYGKYTCRVELKSVEAKTLSNYDVALIIDGGNLCFGGHASRHGDYMNVTVWTD